MKGLERGLNNAVYPKPLMCVIQHPVVTPFKHHKCVRDDEVILNAVFQPPPEHSNCLERFFLVVAAALGGGSLNTHFCEVCVRIN